MTYRDSEREAIVDELLLDADAADSPDVRRALLSMGSFANLAAPTPGAELSAMMAGPHDEVSKRRWRHKHRTAVISVVVVAAMGLGVSGVAAASSGFTRNPSFLDELLRNVRPQPAAAAPVLPIPDAPRVVTEPAPVADPAAIPPVPGAGSIPVPDSVASGQTPAQVQAPAQPQVPGAVQAPAKPSEQPAAGPAHSSATPGSATPGSATPGSATPGSAKPGNATPGGATKPNTAPNPTPGPQAKPGSGKEEKQQAARPDASLQGAGSAGKPAKTLPGADGTNPGHLPPALSNKKAEQLAQTSADKWKQWLKRGDR
ncbi:hypothetical protein [Arthrobacter sp. ISL-95]|uniref:hypothetical protein n=1 Tax=Arthrobacter sp. ISL-95 TaxID=2819116 RepID=UPI001BEA97A0|nr:hypothetical protein [Arthrobacter sp. ISL-95]MBT2584911.1 hypothetical protein [Arthrobacter sp. ISL-95]